MKISVAIMAHPKRVIEAARLYEKLCKMPFTNVALVFDANNNEWETGERSLRSHDYSDWHIIIQDDAMISDHFYDNALTAINNVPSESLVSFYTGKVRPYAQKISQAVEKADAAGANWLRATTLYWGICIAIPTNQIPAIIEHCRLNKREYDRRIGSYYMLHKLPVYYTHPSIVDHDYTIGSLLGNDRVKEPRVAHKYHDALLSEVNKSIINI